MWHVHLRSAMTEEGGLEDISNEGRGIWVIAAIPGIPNRRQLAGDCEPAFCEGLCFGRIALPRYFTSTGIGVHFDLAMSAKPPSRLGCARWLLAGS